MGSLCCVYGYFVSLHKCILGFLGSLMMYMDVDCNDGNVMVVITFEVFWSLSMNVITLNDGNVMVVWLVLFALVMVVWLLLDYLLWKWMW